MRYFIALLITVAVAAAASAETVYLTRAYVSPARLADEFAGYEFDITAGDAAYVELVATAADLETLRAHGIRYAVRETIDTTLAPPAEYTTYDELVVALNNLATTYPGICRLYQLGVSWEGRDILALKISNEPTVNNAAKADICINGNHHAREIMTVEIPLYLAQQLCQLYPTDPDVQLIVDNVETWIIPMTNPDGNNWVWTQYNMWRKNRRDNGPPSNSFGVDLNRNYDYHWGEAGASHDPSSDTYCGPTAFSEPEGFALRDFYNDAAHQFTYTLNYHSYGMDMLYPWAYSTGHPPEPYYQYYQDLADYLLATLPGWEHGNDWECLGYLASGNAVDWQFDGAGHPQQWGFTFEVDTTFQPPASQIPITCAEQYPVLIKLLKLGVESLGYNVAFNVRPRPGALEAAWETAAAPPPAGFNLYRRAAAAGDAAGGEYVRLNGALVTGRSPFSYVDRDVTPGQEYEYLLEAVATSGLAETFGPVRGRAPARVAAKATALYQNWPNPARDKTTIRYELRAPGEATLAVYDLSGRRVKTLTSGPAAAGVHDISWELTDEGGARVAPGVYLYRLTGGGETLCRRLVAAP